MAAANLVQWRRLFRGEGMRPNREITDEEWRSIAPLLPENRPRRDLRGRPLSNSRAVMNAVLWVISTEASWSSLPRTFPPYQTCHRRFKAWHDEGVLEEVIQRIFGDEKEHVYALVLKRMRQSSSKRELNSAAQQETCVDREPVRPMPAAVDAAID
jgi:transposase